MKRTRFFCLSLIFLFLFSAVYAQTATVTSVFGKAEVQENSSWKALAVGDVISAGKVISTGFNSELVLKIGNSTITVKPLSRVTLEQLNVKDGNHNSTVMLDAGSLNADVKAAENKRVGFSVKSPVATASVRGTAGNIDSYGNLESTEGTWSVVEGNVDDAKEEKRQVLVSKGLSISMDSTTGGIVTPQEVCLTNAVGAPASCSTQSETEVCGIANVSPTSVATETAVSQDAKPAASLIITVKIKENNN